MSSSALVGSPRFAWLAVLGLIAVWLSEDGWLSSLEAYYVHSKPLWFKSLVPGDPADSEMAKSYGRFTAPGCAQGSGSLPRDSRSFRRGLEAVFKPEDLSQTASEPHGEQKIPCRHIHRHMMSFNIHVGSLAQVSEMTNPSSWPRVPRERGACATVGWC